MITEALTTPLHAAHKEAGGRFITFAGWKLPVHYGSILDECRAVRTSAGMFDVSHMGRFRVRGPQARDVLQRAGTNDLTKIGPHRAQYTLWLDDKGGVIDDLIVNELSEHEFVVVVNASRREDDLDHLEALAGDADVQIVDETFPTAMIAVQGPDAIATVGRLGATEAETLPRFGVAHSHLDGVGVLLSRTGYTGEDGVELICEAGAGPHVWEAMRAAGVAPCGLGARDALRLEMGYPLYGHELGPDVNPLESGVAFAIAPAARASLPEPQRKLAGFICERPCVPQPGDALSNGGVVTSGGTSVVLGKPVGLAFVPRDVSPGPATLRNRGKDIPVELRELPLIERTRPKTA